MLLSAHSLTLSYNGHHVVQDFNLSIPERFGQDHHPARAGRFD